MKSEVYCDESHPDVFWSQAESRARFLLIEHGRARVIASRAGFPEASAAGVLEEEVSASEARLGLRPLRGGFALSCR
ncbi:MAG: hypothetical protein JW759_08585 [Candidatus Coatesbacteria bacterium]|nr:hypothetical protein [Candidatus Coatesbacteria bacterium]